MNTPRTKTCRNCNRPIHKSTSNARTDPLTISVFTGAWLHDHNDMRGCGLFAEPKEDH
ncbi:hypothetical protein BH765_gp76 [Gordonia phage Kvothe]|uniref:Uncharacterized protein n=1 Tax=Gordonia phage Kvothe TaxID=1838071 RepID=A0A160DE97_9CAUD|nr:hypothetical protein BH765_gp76 [Gordonia phage Kvothe]ANA86138.1 hypothetical protein PBI_KVOTHE_76 [Gordonia phage Kvothe]